jgi:predicted transcriptional regulator
MSKNFKTLTKAEEQVMQALWELKQAFVKDIIDRLPKPKPHYNTISTIVKILEEKGFVSHETLGKSNRYFPVVAKDTYSKGSMKQLMGKYFEGSFANMLSFFVKEKDINIEELETILKEIKKSKH